MTYISPGKRPQCVRVHQHAIWLTHRYLVRRSQPRPRSWMVPWVRGVLPPVPKLCCLDDALHHPTVMSLRCTQQHFTVQTREYIIITNVSVFRTCDEMCHAERGGEGVGGGGVRDGTDGFDGERARPVGYGLEDLQFSEASGGRRARLECRRSCYGRRQYTQ